MLRVLVVVFLLFGCASKSKVQIPWPSYEEIVSSAELTTEDVYPFSQLAKLCPVDHPVVIIMNVEMPGAFAYTGWNEKLQEFNILMGSSAMDNPNIFIDTAIHEWAHAMSWDVSGEDHGPHWGISYAEAWTAVHPER